MAGNKKNRLSKLSDNDEAELAKLGSKKRSLAVNGKPDQSDIDNLTALFRTYDQVTGGRLTKMINDNRMELALNKRDFSKSPVETAETLSFFMPQDLQSEVEKYWPTLWTNKEHIRWFLKRFPVFRR